MLIILQFPLIAENNFGLITAITWSRLSLAQKAMYSQGVYEGIFLLLIADVTEKRRKDTPPLDYNPLVLTPLYILKLLNRYYTMKKVQKNTIAPIQVIFTWQTDGY